MSLASTCFTRTSCLLAALTACTASEPEPAPSFVPGEAPAPLAGAWVDPASADDGSFELAAFREPSLAYAPGVRWIWPGGAVDDATIVSQVAAFADAGYGMIELQTLVAGLDDADLAADARIRTVGTPSFFEHVRTLARAARERGLGFDLTLGSGWPNGGVGVPADASEQQMAWTRVDVQGPGAIDIDVPAATTPSWVNAPVAQLLTAGGLQIAGPPDPAPVLRALVAAPLLGTVDGVAALGSVVDLGTRVSAGRLRWDAPAGAHAVLALYQSRTARVVLGAAYPGTPSATGVIDHLGSEGLRWLLEAQLEPWLAALQEARPDHFFVESFELTGELPWSASLGARYLEETGRNPYLDMPFFFRAGGESKYSEALASEAHPSFASEPAELAARAREQYEQLRARSFAEHYLEPLLRAAHERNIGLRVQAHGGWGVLLDDYARADVPESESLFAGGSFDFLSLAASAAHVAGRRVVSQESFVTLNLLGPDALDQQALWALAGLAYSAGINRLVHNVSAYSYRRVDGTSWWPIANFTSQVEPGPEGAFSLAFNRAQARIGYALSRGEPRTDVAWLMNERAPWDAMVVSTGGVRTHNDESAQSRALRNAGYAYDRVSPGALASARAEAGVATIGSAHYRALFVDSGSVIEPAVMSRLEQLAREGIPIVWLGAPARRAPGLRDTAARDAQVAASWARLGPTLHRVDELEAVAPALRAAGVLPEVETSGLLGPVSVLQRETESGRLIWLFDESGLPQLLSVRVRGAHAGTRALWLDPATGAADELPASADGHALRVSLALPAARGGVLFLPRQ
jgi:alpha-L-rhamnosidase